MKHLMALAACLMASSVSALPTFFVGETVQITKDDVQVIKQLYKREGGVDKYAEVAYEVEFPLYGTWGLTELDVQLTGEIASAWYSSNFGMTVSVYCNDVVVESDTSYGLRYERSSYVVKPQIRVANHPIPAGCESVKVRMDKLGSLARMYFTDIASIDLRLYMTNKF
ncbi:MULTISPECIES: hypothetical protein [Pseudoalteromonas]|uniref:DUF4468 domain-containing protein n=1 Tax=Pseudoalteromonas amylolytica TaxID=1859457 RepID=A0A1S1MZN6_9GAMM|nr:MULTISPECIES: hypothetical protein [Pseudoalteromonas]MCF6436385.1 hypothetical protein [Pseudoalteromonas sp. MMG022]OHU91882.1 hypothetical protein BFC16_01960 [Pseudoalteromonas sp. JW3]OHU93216.1 hypothetical protein BET10_01870 [Pseudoalteromonas amylolytica]